MPIVAKVLVEDVLFLGRIILWSNQVSNMDRNSTIDRYYIENITRYGLWCPKLFSTIAEVRK